MDEAGSWRYHSPTRSLVLGLVLSQVGESSELLLFVVGAWLYRENASARRQSSSETKKLLSLSLWKLQKSRLCRRSSQSSLSRALRWDSVASLGLYRWTELVDIGFWTLDWLNEFRWLTFVFKIANMASKLPSVLGLTDEDVQLLVAAQSHIGTKNCDKQMEPYVWKRRTDG